MNDTSIISSTKEIFFHVYITKEFYFSYTDTHLNYEQVYLSEDQHDDFFNHVDWFAYGLYEQYADNIFLGKGLYYNELFYKIKKNKK